MSPDEPINDRMRRLLTTTRVWAVVGCSPDPSRDSHRVARFLQSKAFRIVPIHPDAQEVLGEQCWPDLASVPASLGVEVVDVFRRADRAGTHVDEAIATGVGAVWLQIGVVDEAAAARARDAGLDVVMDHCPMAEWPVLFG